jgi:PEP-CTERM motif
MSVNASTLRAGAVLRAFALALVVGAVSASPSAALVIALSPDPLAPPPAPFMAAATMAADTWMSTFSDPVTLKFSISAFSAPGGPLGFFDVDPVTSSVGYPLVKGALGFDASSASDVSATGSLQLGGVVDMITNDTTSAPSFRTRYAAPYVFNTELRLTRAQEKALGLLPAADGLPGADGTIKINTAYLPMFDLDPSDGISPGLIDLVAVLTHEMAHGMGFISGVDHIDYASSDGSTSGPDFGTSYTGAAIFTVLDLFRYTAESISLPGQPVVGHVNDWGAGSAGMGFDNPYFSIDGGLSSLAKFSTGIYFGDGAQAQHWKDNSLLPPGPALGLMDPSIGSGELGIVTPLDVTALDVIGWTLIAVPEPSTFLLAACGIAGVALVALRRRRSQD